jgi:hypothetical protein
MKTIIINGQRELAELPELWYTDGTDEANEWKIMVWAGEFHRPGKTNYVANALDTISNGWHKKFENHTYITPSEFLRLVYDPWKESKKVKLPDNYCSVLFELEGKKKAAVHEKYVFPAHINACIQLTNIMNFANDAFEGDGRIWEISSRGISIDDSSSFFFNPIRFTSKAAAEWAYKTFPKIFKAYWNV